MTTKRAGLWVVAAVWSLGGCVEWEQPEPMGGPDWWRGEEPIAVPPDYWGEDGGELAELTLVDGTLEGSMGDVRVFSGSVTQLYAWGSTLSVETAGRGWAAMAIVELPSGLESAEDAFGIGCSGASSGAWEFDEPAQDVDLAYRPATDTEPGAIDFTLQFSNGETTRGHLVVE